MGSSRSPAAKHLEEIEIYVGRQRLGYYIEQGGEWLASNDDDQMLGRYPTRKAAIAAIVASAGRGAQ